ncbi:MAG: tRNA (N(6)-L-threonylcarbamoyladenosine(37)-C(2))-methylthiotransferase MtaB [Sedimentisphaerales bacterium]
MRTFSIYTLGCKVNHYESAQIRQFLENNGLSGAKTGEKPDLCVINTCCVTATASAKSRQYIQRATKSNPKAVKIVCGCLATIQSGELRNPTDSATHLIINRTELASKIKQIIDPQDKPGGFLLPLLTNFKEQTRAFLKIQDGCDGTCSYCIIPKVRPDVQSKPLEDVISEAKALVAAGHKEIVVTGVCLSAYGRQTTRKIDESRATSHESRISDLLTELAQVPGLARIRVSSLEPGDISDQLLDVFCAHKNIMPHIHLSVQSGSDKILRRMCRPYSAGELREKIALIKSRLDRPALTCDIIVGFPGETDEDFEETMELAKWAGFSKMHVFPFSARAGTAAAKMKEKIQPKVVKMRAEILRNLGDELGFKFREQFVGESCEVLLEDGEPPSGRCERYFMVQVNPNGQRLKKNDVVNAQLIINDDNGAKANLVSITSQ